MKTIAISLLTLTTAGLLQAESPLGLICRDDRRMDNGPLNEVILTPGTDGYTLQSQYVPSLNSPNIVIENWAQKLSCRIDEKANLAFCQNSDGQSAQIKERREVFYDSLSEDAKKKSTKFTDISVNENGTASKNISFASGHCETFGG